MISILSLPQVRAAIATECDVCDTPIPAGAWFGAHPEGPQICCGECAKAVNPIFDRNGTEIADLERKRDILVEELNQYSDLLNCCDAGDKLKRTHYQRRIDRIEEDIADIDDDIETRRLDAQRAALDQLKHRVRFVKWREVA